MANLDLPSVWVKVEKALIKSEGTVGKVSRPIEEKLGAVFRGTEKATERVTVTTKPVVGLNLEAFNGAGEKAAKKLTFN